MQYYDDTVWNTKVISTGNVGGSGLSTVTLYDADGLDNGPVSLTCRPAVL